MKHQESVKILEGRAAEALEVLLRQVPAIALEDSKLAVELEPTDCGVDFLARITAPDVIAHPMPGRMPQAPC